MRNNLKMLFLITNQSNCFTLFVLKLGGDTNNTIAEAILDRIVHSAHRIELQGESLRKKGTKNTI